MHPGRWERARISNGKAPGVAGTRELDVSDPRLTWTRLISLPIGLARDAVIADRAPTSPFSLGITL
jgi:hypothetical protein